MEETSVDFCCSGTATLHGIVARILKPDRRRKEIDFLELG